MDCVALVKGRGPYDTRYEYEAAIDMQIGRQGK
jgi:hypothetical protein